MTSIKRRTILKGSLATGAVGVAISTGLLTPAAVMAAWPKAAFDAKSVDDALSGLHGTSSLAGSDKIKLKAPALAENGAVVQISVSTDIADVESISILAEKNASPLAASFVLGAGTQGFASTRIKLGKTSNVIAVVKAGGKLYSTSKEVKVTIGGCGG